MRLGVLGAGAFGTALAITQAQSRQVTLWARRAEHAAEMARTRINEARLPDVNLPQSIHITADLRDIARVETVLIVLPLQKLRRFLEGHGAALTGKALVACCKGMELTTGYGPLQIIDEALPGQKRALLTGPSFARDIAKGLPTALTLACADDALGKTLQKQLSNDTLRLYRTTDETGASLGGALKNVVAIACGASIGAGLGQSARAAVMTRGNAEMQRLATHMGADPVTLSGLSGFGDLVLTCTSDLSRNYRLGLSIGSGTTFDAAITVEGAATARAVAAYAQKAGLDMPIATAVAALVENRLDVRDAMKALLSRSLKEE
ncbi:MAG: NAD(P)H-dependent glycerol-3-phosphate dehydrogenase [Roseobacter sp.]|jgi:glycerol-3-phosphate dehydrogenase (NAD(P)+)|nr:NAD(P)H-dependent glycerol-3-phosphate dehydrogenase [Roseobacter sp.]